MSEEEISCHRVDLIKALWEGVLEPDHAARLVVVTCGCVVALTFVVSTATQNFSQVDKLWSIAPVMYAWMAVTDRRTLLMAIVATVWGVRLTWNFHRRGGYQLPYIWQGDQDYRWAEIRKGKFLPMLKHFVPWMIFNLAFISFYQNVLLLLIASPSLVAYMVAKKACKGGNEDNALSLLDVLAATLVLIFVVVESIADNQQYAFQTEKHRRKKAGEPLTGDYADGFCQSGLFAILRKPNYAAEQAIWISYYLFSVAATKKWCNWSALGCILLCALFQSSAWFTEFLTLQKYPKYVEYKRRVPLFVPNPLKLLLRRGCMAKEH